MSEATGERRGIFRASGRSSWPVEILIAFGVVVLAALARALLNLVSPEIAPFALAYPAVLAATLLAGWRSGAIAFAILIATQVAVRLSAQSGEAGLTAAEGIELLVEAGCLFAVLAVSQAFRLATGKAEAERSASLANRDLLLAELNHRVKNNFQMVASLLEMQRRRAPDIQSETAFAETLRRVRNMAEAHQSLNAAGEAGGLVDVSAYLKDLCERLAESLLLKGLVQLRYRGESAMLPSARVAALGMVVNELVTNAAKYAFPGGREGTIEVRFDKTEAGYRLCVADDGVGQAQEAGPKGSGLGQRLIEAFAREADGTVSRPKGDGTIVVVDLEK